MRSMSYFCGLRITSTVGNFTNLGSTIPRTLNGYAPSSINCRRLCTQVGQLYLTRFAAHCSLPTPKDNFHSWPTAVSPTPPPYFRNFRNCATLAPSFPKMR
jgi:hypothetical protein